MRLNHLIHVCKSVTILLLLLASGVGVAHAQKQGEAGQQSPAKPTVILPAHNAPMPAARETELYCAGFIQYAPSPNQLEVVGGEQEQEQRVYSEGDNVFINAGANYGVRVGQEYSVIRPRGQFTTKLTKKKGWLGVYTPEIGRLRVTEVKDRVSVALVVRSCETILLGDLLRAVPQRVSPAARPNTPFDRFADPSGKQQGHIVLARNGREMLSTDEIVFIDLGTEDGIKMGDYLTVYRPAGTGNITRFRDEEITPTASDGFESERFRGGKFSLKAQRVKDPNRTGIYGPMVTTPEVERRRPPVPRKVVGEVVVLNVQARTATAVITRVAQEVHTGDFVELQ